MMSLIHFLSIDFKNALHIILLKNNNVYINYILQYAIARLNKRLMKIIKIKKNIHFYF